MIKNVTVTVIGEQRSNRDEEHVEPMELVTRGTLHEKDGVFYLKYDDKGLDLTKKGAVSAVMSFRVGETREAFYATPMGTMDISILTEAYEMVRTDEGMAIVLVYIMDYGHNCLSFNVLRVSVSEE